MNPEAVSRHFPPTIAFPDELALLCKWHEGHGYPISGGFEFNDSQLNPIAQWFGSDAANERLAAFGAGPDGSLLAVWLQDNGSSRIVHMGSEGQNNFVLAQSMRDFLQLLAVGYSELGFDDLSNPPAPEGINKTFQKWVAKTFGLIVPRTGGALVASAQAASESFDAWVKKVAQ